MKKRDAIIDIVKGIGIILMVLRHARAPYSDFVMLFHMALFFIASGYLYKPLPDNTLRNYFSFIKKKIKGLYIPYVGWTLAFVLLNNAFIKLYIYVENTIEVDLAQVESISVVQRMGRLDIIKAFVRTLLLKQDTTMGGALWFFKVLLITLAVYAGIEYLLRRFLTKKHYLLAQSVIAIVMLLGGYYCSLAGISVSGLSRVLSVYILIHIGVLLKNGKVMEAISKNMSRVIFIMIIGFILLLILYQFGEIAIDRNAIENPVFFLVASLAGWFFTYAFAFLLQRARFVGNKGLEYISRNSVVIIVLHFLCFKVVSYVEIMLYGMSMEYISAFPVLYSDGMWWLAYTVVGIAGALILQFIFQKIKVALLKK